MQWNLTFVLMATVRCSRGSRVRLRYGFEHTKKRSTSPGGPAHSFHPSQTSASAGTRTQMIMQYSWMRPPRRLALRSPGVSALREQRNGESR